MKQSKTFARVCGILAIVIAVAGILLYLFAPGITLRPNAFGKGSGLTVEASANMLDLQEELFDLREAARDALEEMSEELDDLTSRVPESVREQYDGYVRLMRSLSYYPVIFMVCMVTALLGFAIAVVFGLTELLGIRKKWNTPKMITVGGAVHILANLVLIGLTAKIVYDFLSLSQLGDMSEWLGVEIKEMSVTPWGVTLSVLRCLGIGMILSLVFALVLIVLGCIAPKCAAAGKARIEENGPDDWNSGNMQAPRMQEPAGGRIMGISGEYSGYEINLSVGERVTLGSDPSVSQIVFSAPDISPLHCSIVCVPDMAQFGSTRVRYEIQNFAAYATGCTGEGRSLAGNERVLVEAGTELWLADGTNRFRLG